MNSSYGRAMKAVREDETAAEAMAINALRTKTSGVYVQRLLSGRSRRPSGSPDHHHFAFPVYFYAHVQSPDHDRHRWAGKHDWGSDRRSVW